MKKILVTGATGYIGSHLVKKLAGHGHNVIATDFNLEQNDVSKYVSKTVDWDIRHKTKILIDDYDAVVHLAAMTKVSISVENPFDYYQTNIIGTHNVTQSLNYGHFVYASTGCAYKPESSPYAMSKRAGEDMMNYLENYTICRFYNVCGNDGFNKFDNQHYHLIRKAAAVINGLYPSLDVYGTDYETRDGTTIRNYTHVSDITDSLIRIVDNGPTRKIECLGNTTGYTVLEVIEAMKKATGVDFKVNYTERRSGDLDVSVLPEQSKFFTQTRSLEDQCISALDWEK